MQAWLLTIALSLGCNRDAIDPPPTWQIRLSPDAPSVLRQTAEEVQDTLRQMGAEATLSEAQGSPRCTPGVNTLDLLGDGLGQVDFPARVKWDGSPVESKDLTLPGSRKAAEKRAAQTWRIQTSQCSNGLHVALSGGGLLGRQYAAYEWLHRLGVRFFHPEESWLPEKLPQSLPIINKQHTPAFAYRGVTLHLTHPLELGDAFKSDDEDAALEGVRYIDWQVRNAASLGMPGVGKGAWSTYGLDRGFSPTRSLNLRDVQQGSQASQQAATQQSILAAVDQVLDGEADGPEFLSVGVRISEFNFIDDQQAVNELTWVTEHLTENYPNVTPQTVAHGTHSPPTPKYGVPFSLLPQFAPKELSVSVHPLMFYDLSRPAPVYGNKDFKYFHEFMVDQQHKRELWYYPEAAWWLTFDIAVPLYLPITIEARDRDIQLLRPLLDAGLTGHQVFGTGQEWGYWQNEYCSLRLSADIDYRWTDCLRDIAMPFGASASQVVSALKQVVEWQQEDLFDAERLRWLVGTDPETELGAKAGIHFHPLPPHPAEILQWQESEARAFLEDTAPWLDEVYTRYSGLAEDLKSLRQEIPRRAVYLLDEIIDGIEMFALRAQHQRLAYAAVVEQRLQDLTQQPAAASPRELLASAIATTEAALQVVARREAHYRYKPLSRAIAGGPLGKEDKNWTTYSYRYLNRTHYAYYYRLIDARVSAALQGNPITVTSSVLKSGVPLELRLGEQLTDARIDFGDGAASQAHGGQTLEHNYAAASVYSLLVESTSDAGSLGLDAEIAVVASGFMSTEAADLIDPAGAEVIEPTLPGLVIGELDPDTALLAFSAKSDGNVAPGEWTQARFVEHSADTWRAEAQELDVPVVEQSAGSVLARVRITQAEVSVSIADKTADFSGRLNTESLVQAVVDVSGGAFELDGAHALVAQLLGYEDAPLPSDLPYLLRYQVDAL